MIKQHIKKFTGTPFSVICDTIENGVGFMNSIKVSIYRKDTQDEKLIGEYIRNYSHYGALTFYPFKIEDNWYALYSAEYTTLRVMKLHSDRIEDWCGEEPSPGGFCPVEIYVPKYIHSIQSYRRAIDDTEEYSAYYADCDLDEKDYQKELISTGFVSEEYCNFGFLCGCRWGDDSTWKIRYVNLAQIPNKNLNIIDKFGYWEMPSQLSLRECVDMSGWTPDDQGIRLTKSEFIYL